MHHITVNYSDFILHAYSVTAIMPRSRALHRIGNRILYDTAKHIQSQALSGNRTRYRRSPRIERVVTRLISTSIGVPAFSSVVTALFSARLDFTPNDTANLSQSQAFVCNTQTAG